ncbi:hypothetical protein [Escherichia coli]|uniref:hypothetical protein n=1 Tax=Escherichia coli TaxID=562 RepID=UPI0010A6021E|nr:hypothetical protein [Escherichia coli]
MYLKTDEKKENVIENQVDKTEDRPQRKRNFTKSMESFNRLLDNENQESNNKTTVKKLLV